VHRAAEHVGPSRDAASAGRQFEKHTAGAPIREALIRHRSTGHPDAQLIERRLADRPSRSGDRQAIAGGVFFRA